MADEVPELPAASRAIAEIACEPLGTPVVCQVTAKGAAEAVPTSAPSTRKSTEVTPIASLAAAVRVAVPARRAAGVGAVTATAGGVASAVTSTAAANCRGPPVASEVETLQTARRAPGVVQVGNTSATACDLP